MSAKPKRSMSAKTDRGEGLRDRSAALETPESATDGVGSETVRLNANIPAVEHEALLRLATAHGKTMKEVVRLGLSLAKVALTETREGNTIVVVDPRGTIVKQLIIT